MKPEQYYADLLPEGSEPALTALVQELDAVYTAPQRPVGLSWTTASQRLRMVASHSADAETSLQTRPSRRVSIGRNVRWLVAAAALILVLVGTGFAGPLIHWPGGSAGAPLAYADINQSMQISNGVTLTATKGYVDPKHLVLYFDARLSGNLANTYTGPLVSESNIQGKDAKAIWALLGDTAVNHGAIVVPSGGDIAGKVLQVTWHITEVELISKVPGQAPLFLKGDWTLRFSLPFHHDVQEPLQLDFPGVSPLPVN